MCTHEFNKAVLVKHTAVLYIEIMGRRNDLKIVAIANGLTLQDLREKSSTPLVVKVFSVYMESIVVYRGLVSGLHFA